MKPARARVDKGLLQKAIPDDDAPEEDPELDITRQSLVAKEAQDEATNYVVITNLRNKMNNFIQEIHLDMLAWGSLEDQIDKRAVAEIVGTPTKKKEKEEEKKFSSSKKTPAKRNK